MKRVAKWLATGGMPSKAVVALLAVTALLGLT